MKRLVYITEEWKSIPGYEEYEASSKGQVRRAKIAGTNRTFIGKIIRQYMDRDGYMRCTLFKDGKNKAGLRVHILVCLAFHGLRLRERPFVNHKNCHKDDNWAANLEWCTRKENHKHAKESGMIVKTPSGGNNSLAKRYVVVTPNGDVIRIRGLNEFCKKHNLKTGSMSMVATGTQKHHKGWKCNYDV